MKLPLEPILKPIVLFLTDARRWPRFASFTKRFLFKRFRILVYEKGRPKILHAAYDDGGEVVVELDFDDQFICRFQGPLDVADAIGKLRRYLQRSNIVSLSDCVLNEESVAAIALFTSLSCMMIKNCSLNGASLGSMNHPAIQELHIEGGRIPEKAIADWIVNLEKLQSLRFQNLQDFRGTCFATFVEQKKNGRPSNLSDVYISECKGFQQENLAHLQACGQFDSLDIWKTPLTNESFAEIAKIGNIRRVALVETAVSGGLEYLAGLPNLRYVSLNQTQIRSLSELLPLIKIASERPMQIDCDTLSAEEEAMLSEKMYEQYQKRRLREENNSS